MTMQNIVHRVGRPMLDIQVTMSDTGWSPSSGLHSTPCTASSAAAGRDASVEGLAGEVR